MTKALQGIGLVALLAWTGLGAFAWSQVKGRVEVTVRDADGPEDDGLALLDDRLTSLSSDLDALVGSLDSNFRLLADALESTGADAGLVEERLARLEAALPHALEAREVAGALGATLDDLRGLVADVRTHGAFADDAAPSPAESRVARPVSEELPEDVPAAQDDAPGVPEEPAAETADVPAAGSLAAEPEPARSFLAFRLPSRDFRFEGAQDFDVLGDLSRVGFDAKSTLHDFTGISEKVSGSFRVDLAQPEAGLSGRIAIDASSLDTGLEDRDEAMLEHLEGERFEEIVFEPTGFEPSSVDPEAMHVSGTLLGRMTVHGVTRDLRVKVRGHVDESRRFVVEGEVPILLSDFDVEAPSQLGVISMEDQVTVWLNLRTRARQGGSR